MPRRVDDQTEVFSRLCPAGRLGGSRKTNGAEAIAMLVEVGFKVQRREAPESLESAVIGCSDLVNSVGLDCVSGCH
jgi:hypothetical protein